MSTSTQAAHDDSLDDPSGKLSDRFSWTTEVLAGLTVSFVAISLGAAFGVQSERGALAGILSAGVIALITALLGGTRIQCSGPTAPMTAVTLAMVGVIGGGLLKNHPGVSLDQFINMTLVLTGLLMLLAAVLRLGKFINFVPKVVISGFMNGIALLIWLGEIKTLFGLGGREVMLGGIAPNLSIAIAAAALCFALGPLLKQISVRLSSFLPATLLAIIVVTAAVALTGVQIQTVKLGGTLSSLKDATDLVTTQFPTQWSWELALLALPFAGQLAMLAYLDTLLTSLVIDKKATILLGKPELTKQNQELAAQGVANAAIACIGGIPGAQATIRSVLILNEGARTRLAGVLVGVFVLVEMILFQNWIAMIPKAVFSGVLIKVGYDVFDWQPLKIYFRELREGAVPNATSKTTRPMVTHLNMFFILGTTLVTVLVNLNVAVIAFTALFYAIKLARPVHDLAPVDETEGFADED